MEKLQRPEYEALVERILAGEITRDQAADISSEQTGKSRSTFLTWIRNSGAAERLKAVRGSVGSRNIHAHKDPVKVDAYEAAMALALSGKVSIRHAAAKYEVSYPYLQRRVQAARGTTGSQVPA